MKPLLRAWASVLLAARRLRAQAGLALATTLGLVVLLALVMSIPSYADAVSYRILSAGLQAGAAPDEAAAGARPPFRVVFQYNGPFRGALQWEQIVSTDRYLMGRAAQDLGLPLERSARYLKTYPFKAAPPERASAPESEGGFFWTSFFTLPGFEDHVEVVEGRLAEPPGADPQAPVEVLVSESQANTVGLSIGQTLAAYNRDSDGLTLIPVKVVGVWRAVDPNAPYWWISPRDLSGDLYVPEGVYLGRLVPQMADELGQVTWFLALRSGDFHAGQVPGFLTRLGRVNQQTAGMTSGLFLKESPEKMMLDYRGTTNLLTFLLTVFSVPVAALFLAFINLVGSVTIERQRNEIAVLRSRGATPGQVAAMVGAEGLLLVTAAALAGIPASLGILYLMGKTRSFLDFSLPASLRLDVTALSLVFCVLAAALVLGARVWPVFGVAADTVTTYKRDFSRSIRAPGWQRAGLDLLLFLPTAYGALLLRGQGSLVLPGMNPDNPLINPADPFQNPLLVLVPALGIFAATLLLLRLLPWAMSAMAWVAARTRSVGLLMATRHLARAPRFYAAPLLLLVLTLSLSAYTASLAQTLDIHSYDQNYYRYGADVNLMEWGQCLKRDSFGNCDRNASTEESPTWSFLPVEVHEEIPGVEAAVRVGVWPARTAMSGASLPAQFIGLDRAKFTEVAFWREDFATASLGELMNQLATAPNSALVSRQYMEEAALQVGDPIILTVDVAGQLKTIQMVLAGSFDYFPTWYPDQGPLFVSNLDDFFEQIQGQQPYNVWLKTGAQVQCGPLVRDLRDPRALGLDVQSCISSRDKIVQEQSRPEHQGLFGMLSVGFAGAALLTVLGFLLYILFSFQQRFVEMGILRAMGLSAGQMRVLLAWELAFLILTGILAGTGLGVLVSRAFIPYVQVGAESAARIPPFTVEIAWDRIRDVYAMFGGMFLAALLGLSRLLQRNKIFQAIKLGETT